MKSGYRYLFGPVLSRRLGTSLGIDIIPAKTCSYDCVFCEVGRTTTLTTQRRKYVPVKDVVREVVSWIKGGGKADWITVAGSGEPTLHSGLSGILRSLRAATGMRVALLSNGSLFGSAAVRKAAARADLVKVSLGAWDDKSFLALNQPAPGLGLGRVVDGLRKFRADFKGELWVEVVLVKGVNDIVRDVRRIAALVKSIHPDEIHLNTVTRPPACRGAAPADERAMRRLVRWFGPSARIIAHTHRTTHAGGDPDRAALMRLLRRRPCTTAEIAVGMAWDRAATVSMVEDMVRKGILRRQSRSGFDYYVASTIRGRKRHSAVR